MILGLRGVGKTVLLNEIRKEAEARGYLVEQIEARDGEDLRQLLIHALRRVLLQLDRPGQTIEAVKKGLRVLRSFIGKITVGAGGVDVTLGVDPELGHADSGDFESDVKDVLAATAQAAKEAKRPVVLLIDELQCVSRSELAALIRGIHAVNQAGLPLLLFAAGLPQLAGQAGDAKSYAERLFDFPRPDRLAKEIDWPKRMLPRPSVIRLSKKVPALRRRRWTKFTPRPGAILVFCKSGATTLGT